MTTQNQVVSPPVGVAIVGRPFVDALLDPRTAFASPDVVANHAWLSREEKRLILSSWAGDLLRDARDGTVQTAACEAVLGTLARFDPAAADEFEGAFATLSPDREGGRAQN
jgi:hypothetical protein